MRHFLLIADKCREVQESKTGGSASSKKPYESKTDCKWTLITDPGKYIEVQVRRIWPYAQYCSKDNCNNPPCSQPPQGT